MNHGSNNVNFPSIKLSHIISCTTRVNSDKQTAENWPCALFNLIIQTKLIYLLRKKFPDILVNPNFPLYFRKKALRALNERLSKHKTEPNVEDEETEWPTMEEENRHETSEPKENELTEVVSDSSKNELAKESEETSNSNENNTGPT